MDEVPIPTGLTRREALKRGLALGGALTWATPVVQLVGMQPALAQVPSPSCDATVCTNVFVGSMVVGSFLCEPATAEDEACFCCCAGITEFCSQCGKECTQVEITCGDFQPVSCADRGF